MNDLKVPDDLDKLEYYLLTLIVNNDTDLPTKVPTHWTPLIENLLQKQYIKIIDNDIFLRSKTKELFERELRSDEQKFLEVFNNYPIKTPNGRALRPKGTDTKEYKELLGKYIRKVLKKNKHDYVVQCLDNELLSRKRTNSLEFMNAMTAWLNGEMWDRYPIEENESKTDFKTDI